MRTNLPKSYSVITHGGAPAVPHLSPYAELRRTVLSCLLWEDQFYESGESIADRIAKGAGQVSASELSALAIEARNVQHLRHVPLLLCVHLAKKGGGLVSKTLYEVIQRPDELAEFLALYWRKGKTPISKQVKKGLAAAFTKFNEYSLAKYNREGAIKLRDVLFMVHAKPKDAEQEAVWKRLVDGTLVTPDTWEVNLSGGADKKETFERLLMENKLCYLALLRNLRNMIDADCDLTLVKQAILNRANGADKVLPFRYIAAAKAAPALEETLDAAFLASFSGVQKLPGKTVAIVDISGSMTSALSGKSDMTRALAANALAAICREVCEDPRIYATAGNDASRKHATGLIPNRRGMALIDALSAANKELGGGGIFLKQVMDYIYSKEKDIARVIIITDEQDCAAYPEDSPKNARLLGKHNYMINVASYKNGIGYNAWTHINGFSEGVIRWIFEYERGQALDIDI